MITKLLNRLADILIKPIMEAIEAIQGDRADLEALSCDRKCGKRRTPNEHCENQLHAVGLEAVQDALDESKDETLPTEDSQVVDEIKKVNIAAAENVCYICGKPAHYMTSWGQRVCSLACKEHGIAEREAVRAVLAENIRAAESVKPKIIDGEIVFPNTMTATEAIVSRWQGALLGVGFTNKEIIEIKWTNHDNILYVTHPNHKPMIIQNGKVEFVELPYWAREIPQELKDAEKSVRDGILENKAHVKATKKACKESIGHEVE